MPTFDLALEETLQLRFLFPVLLLSLANLPTAVGATIAFSGTFAVDDDVVLFHYSVQNTGLVTVSTTSYAGGGFQTILSLFDATGNFLFDNTGYGSASDASFSWNSVAGEQYIVALTQYDNFSLQTTLLDGFVQQGNGNFTADLPFNNPTPGGQFLLPGGEQRTSAWAVEFSADDSSLQASQEGAVPEPATFVLSGTGLLACFLLASRRAGR